MEITKIFSNIEEESEKLYSIRLSENEVALFNEFQKEFNSKAQKALRAKAAENNALQFASKYKSDFGETVSNPKYTQYDSLGGVKKFDRNVRKWESLSDPLEYKKAFKDATGKSPMSKDPWKLEKLRAKKAGGMIGSTPAPQRPVQKFAKKVSSGLKNLLKKKL